MSASIAFAVEPPSTISSVEYKAAATANAKTPSEKYGRTSRASQLMGKSVKNMKGEKLGDVNDIIVDVAAGRVVAVVISTGGFLGISDELSIVPPGALRFVGGTDELQLDVTKESLSNAPRFKAGEWPDLGKEGYISSVYSAYKMDDRSGQPGADTADNTGLNSRDTDGNNPTPLDQGNSRSDTDITAKIRKDVMAQEGLSMNAQNIKIITTNGKVTLRGPVTNAEEKRLIRDLAVKATGKDSVDDQLEVK